MGLIFWSNLGYAGTFGQKGPKIDAAESILIPKSALHGHFSAKRAKIGRFGPFLGVKNGPKMTPGHKCVCGAGHFDCLSVLGPAGNHGFGERGGDVRLTNSAPIGGHKRLTSMKFWEFSKFGMPGSVCERHLGA